MLSKGLFRSERELDDEDTLARESSLGFSCVDEGGPRWLWLQTLRRRLRVCGEDILVDGGATSMRESSSSWVLLPPDPPFSAYHIISWNMSCIISWRCTTLADPLTGFLRLASVLPMHGLDFWD